MDELTKLCAGPRLRGPVNELMGNGKLAEEVRTLRALIRHEGNKTYVEDGNGFVVFDRSWCFTQVWLERCALDLVREGLKKGRKLSKIARRKEDAIEDRPGIVIVWEEM